MHRFANQQTRETVAFLFGRGLYEGMKEFWTAPERADAVDEVVRLRAPHPSAEIAAGVAQRW